MVHFEERQKENQRDCFNCSTIPSSAKIPLISLLLFVVRLIFHDARNKLQVFGTIHKHFVPLMV